MKLLILVILLATIASPVMATYVPADGTVVTLPVASGWYDVYATGVFNFGGTEYPWAYADAEWVHVLDTWAENGPWQNNLCDLSINGSFWDWKGLLPDGTYATHTFSEVHNYKLTLYAENELRFWIYDSGYQDNTGGLDVTIETTVSEPSCLLALAGCLSALGFLKRGKVR